VVAKTNHLDALSFADALRTDGHGWRQLKPEDSKIQELRLLCRDEINLIEQRAALVNQLQQTLYEYYPAALEAFDDWTTPGPWAFIERFPTPQALKKAGKRHWEKFLHTHRLYRRKTYQKRLDYFAHATEFSGSQAVTNAKSILAVSLAKQLRVLQQQLKVYRDRIEKLFQEHPDHDLFGSLLNFCKMGVRHTLVKKFGFGNFFTNPITVLVSRTYCFAEKYGLN